MKKLLCITIIAFLLNGCKDSQKIFFCEGLSPKGEKIKCGTVFTTGDLTAVLELDEPFETEKLQVSIWAVKKLKNETPRILNIGVKPDARKASIDLSFYNEGLHRVAVYGRNKNIIAQGDIKIVDSY